MIRKDFELATGQNHHHVFSRETIKPSSPTHSHLKRYNLSSMDQVMCRNYIPIVFFFPSNGGDIQEKIGEKSRQLKHSLSETLTQYYPFAGRLTSAGAYVDCNDEGIEFEEARLECGLSEILKKYEDDDASDLDLVFPHGLVWAPFANDSSLMIVRLNYFDCGGFAIAVCLSHRIADGCTFATFMNYWGALTRQSGEQVLPHFISSPSNNDDSVTIQELQIPKRNRVTRTRRYVFKNTEIAQLMATVAFPDGQSPTRLEFLAALLYKSAITAEKSNSGSLRPSVLIHPVNMRPMMVPQIPKTSVGNWFWQLHIRTTTESESSLNALTDQIKKGKMQIGGMKSLDGQEFMSRMLGTIENNHKVYMSGSMCNMELYKVNFGWGNPVQVALGDSLFPNCFHFMDTPSGDGIEALVCFEEQEMVEFHLDNELEALASLN